MIRGILMLPQKNLTTNEQINMYRYPHFMDDATGMLVNPCPPFCPALQEGLVIQNKEGDVKSHVLFHCRKHALLSIAVF